MELPDEPAPQRQDNIQPQDESFQNKVKIACLFSSRFHLQLLQLLLMDIKG
jgi:hypothetical protein